MDAYPHEYVEHNLPLVLLSGLGEDDTGFGSLGPSAKQESGTKITTKSAECAQEKANPLLQQFLRYDGSEDAWNSTSLPGPTGTLKYSVRQIGRTYALPARKAAPPPQSAEEGVGTPNAQARHIELHSPLSPLSPGSPVFPDGVFTPVWLSKHQQHVPALIIGCFDLRAQGSAEDDEVIKQDINAFRTALSRSGYKCRFAAILLSDSGILHAPQLEERLSTIRRATALDPKTGLFFMPPMSSQAEIATFVQSILTTLQSGIVEYYRELTKHARRKKSRGSAPTPAASMMRGTSQSLSTPGWNVRYEFKQGVFAEFRQEMDVAERHYSVAIDELFNPEGIFEATPSWSPRWAEARLLCDAIACRVIRCQLWMGESTGAVQSWVNYRFRMKDLVDRRGKGSQTYSWEAWEARWARIMAQLIERAELSAFTTPAKKAMDDSIEVQKQLIYAMPEKNAANPERLPPFELLHHPGYWHRLAALRSQARWDRAKAIPPEDRTPPSQTPASSVANRTRTYDTYLAPDPHEEAEVDHLSYIAASYNQAIDEFHHRGQLRMAEHSRLELGLSLETGSRQAEALEVLVPLWRETYWRVEGWQNLFQVLLESLQRCLLKSSHSAEVLLAVTWELLHQDYSQQPGSTTKIDLFHCLDQCESEAKVMLQMRDVERTSPISVSLAFEGREGHVGEPLLCQLTIASVSRDNAAPVQLEKVVVQFTDSRTVSLSHRGSSDRPAGRSATEDVALVAEQGGSSMTAEVDLMFEPAQRRTFNFPVVFREAMIIEVAQVSLLVSRDNFNLEHVFADQALLRSPHWINDSEDGESTRMTLTQGETSSVMILPKPPKVQMAVHHLRKRYYSGEVISLELELANEEAEDVVAKLRADISSDGLSAMDVSWNDVQSKKGEASESNDHNHATGTEAFKLEISATQKMTLFVTGPVEAGSALLNIGIQYTLTSDSSVPMAKNLTIDLTFILPFEAKFNFGPLLNQDAWPSLFDAKSTTLNSACGIPHKWRLGSQIIALTTDTVHVKELEIVIDNSVGDADCRVVSQEQRPTEIQSLQKIARNFELITQKRSLDDRRSASLEISLAIRWSLDKDGPLFTSILPAPRLTVPCSEPRALCTLSHVDLPEADATICYHLENPSMHFLTFALTMEASEDFAFSGPKYRTLSLAPLSRHKIDYRIMLYQDEKGETKESKTGRWIWPNLQVVDSYYQKTLRVQAAGVGLKMDEKLGVGVWIENVSR